MLLFIIVPYPLYIQSCLIILVIFQKGYCNKDWFLKTNAFTSGQDYAVYVNKSFTIYSVSLCFLLESLINFVTRMLDSETLLGMLILLRSSALKLALVHFLICSTWRLQFCNNIYHYNTERECCVVQVHVYTKYKE